MKLIFSPFFAAGVPLLSLSAYFIPGKLHTTSTKKIFVILAYDSDNEITGY
jgi:hypothetical protein